MSYENEDEYQTNELAEAIEKRNRKYHKAMQKGNGNCCKKSFTKYKPLLINLNVTQQLITV